MSLLEKIFGSAILAAFEQEILTAEIGKACLGGHATVVSVDPVEGTVVELKFTDGIDYLITVKRKYA